MVYCCRIRFISKHPMLLFNELCSWDNWSCVIFQNILCYCLTIIGNVACLQLQVFQNILCYCLTLSPLPPAGVPLISKHPMLLFNQDGTGVAGTVTIISKHPMLLFNLTLIWGRFKCGKFQNILCYCLTALCDTLGNLFLWFQNILCYCLTVKMPSDKQLNKDFKTSYVTV